MDDDQVELVLGCQGGLDLSSERRSAIVSLIGNRTEWDRRSNHCRCAASRKQASKMC